MAGDAFEEAEMHDGSPIVHRDKLVSRGMTGIMLGGGSLPLLVGILVALTNSTASRPVPPGAVPLVVALTAALSVALWITGIVFGVVRTVVTKQAVHVKYGLWGPTIPLDAIESARVVEYDWTEFGGWGLRIGKDGARAYVPQNGPCVELVYREGGKTKRLLVGAAEASRTVRAIEEARGRVRIADDGSSRAEDEAALEAAEAEAEEAETDAEGSASRKV